MLSNVEPFVNAQKIPSSSGTVTDGNENPALIYK